jgi:TolB protein
MIPDIKHKVVWLVFLFVTSVGCSIQALIPSNSPSIPTNTVLPATIPITSTIEIIPTFTRTPTSEPSGKIAFTCQMAGIRYLDQICMINADGTGFTRLTSDDNAAHFYPSVAPDGMSVVYSANPTGIYEIYEIDFQGHSRQLTNGLGTLTSPEISPDGESIAFTLGDGTGTSIWVTNRDGNQPKMVYGPGWDPTWSPDGKKILFASYDGFNSIQLFTVNIDGADLKQVTQMANLRGRSDWSPDGRWAVTYAGEPWERDLYLIPMNGGDPTQLTPAEGNSQGPSFSPDGRWVVFTAYFGDIDNEDGCEIYMIRIDGTQLTRLTQNEYCDWQPRWGP